MEISTLIRSVVMIITTILIGVPVAIYKFFTWTLPFWLQSLFCCAPGYVPGQKNDKFADIDPQEILNDPANGEQHMLEVNGIKIHAVTRGKQGEKPMMLFLHGFPDIWYGWKNYMEYYEENYFTVAIDMRGYGDSSAPTTRSAYALETLAKDIKEVVEAFEYENCVLITHDWGSVVGWTVSGLYPDLISKFVAMDAPTPMIIHDYKLSPLQIIRSWYIFLFNIPFFGLWFARAGNCYYLDDIITNKEAKAFSETDLPIYKYHLTVNNPNDFASMNRYYQNLMIPGPKAATRKALRKKLQMPVLVMWGMADKYFDNNWMTWMLKGYVESDMLTIVKFPGAGHFIQRERTKKVMKNIDDFLATHSS